jgi:hypothetical protein
LWRRQIDADLAGRRAGLAMAPAIAVVTSLISRSALPISRTASTEFLVEVWIRPTFWPISIAVPVHAHRDFVA